MLYTVKILGGELQVVRAKSAEGAAKRAVGAKRSYNVWCEGNGIYVVTKRARTGGELVVARVAVYK